ncbi:hypothetical protein [Bacteroides acidifaciens]|uniref:hypothetical protein n=1 Tax=Bacteroides acidifaciens TaxID=85831 RepID=UPI0030146093
MKTNLNYCIVLSSEQLAYLAGSKYGVDRMKILHQLIEAAVLKETDYTTKGFSTTLRVGQAILSEVDLSSKSGYDKKTISRVLDKMNQLEIVASTQNNRTSVHTLKCISAWMQDGNRIDNPFYVRIKDRQEEGEDDCRQTEATNEGCVSDSDFSFAGKMPVISDNGEIPFSIISVSSQPTAGEESNEDISADSQI